MQWSNLYFPKVPCVPHAICAFVFVSRLQSLPHLDVLQCAAVQVAHDQPRHSPRQQLMHEKRRAVGSYSEIVRFVRGIDDLTVNVDADGFGRIRRTKLLGVRAQVAEAHYHAAVGSPAKAFVIRRERQHVAEQVAVSVQDRKAMSFGRVSAFLAGKQHHCRIVLRPARCHNAIQIVDHFRGLERFANRRARGNWSFRHRCRWCGILRSPGCRRPFRHAFGFRLHCRSIAVKPKKQDGGSKGKTRYGKSRDVASLSMATSSSAHWQGCSACGSTCLVWLSFHWE